MKTKNILLCSAFIMLASAVYATKIPKMNIIPFETQKAVVEFESFQPTLFELTVKDNNGDILMYKKSEKPLDNFNTVFDFSSLADGTYCIVFNFGNCSIKRDVKVANSNLVISEERKDCKPYFQYDKNELRVSLFNKYQKNIYLNIYQNGEHLTGVKLGNDLCLQKKVDLSKLRKGNYEFVLSDEINDYQFALNK